MRLALVALLVPDYDAALAFFVDGLGWTCTADESQGHKRWVTVAPPGGGTALLLARAVGDQVRAVGDQHGGRVGFFLQTDDFTRDAARIEAAGGVFQEAPRAEPYGTVAVWRDPWGNRWDLIESGRA
ncbi:MAG: VOC family protein [Pseudomonadota bacterium]